VLWVLVRTEFRARYRAQALGIVWSLLNPLVMMGIISVIFTQLFRSAEKFFPIFLLIGLLLWQWFSTSLNSATGIFVSNADIIKRTVFARPLLPIASVLSFGINFLLECVVLIAFIPIFPGSVSALAGAAAGTGAAAADGRAHLGNFAGHLGAETSSIATSRTWSAPACSCCTGRRRCFTPSTSFRSRSAPSSSATHSPES
jgi:hypothetical protein